MTERAVHIGQHIQSAEQHLFNARAEALESQADTPYEGQTVLEELLRAQMAINKAIETYLAD